MEWSDMIDKKCVVCRSSFKCRRIIAERAYICEKCDAERELYGKICSEIDKLIEENSSNEFFKKEYAEYIKARFSAKETVLVMKYLFGDPEEKQKEITTTV